MKCATKIIIYTNQSEIPQEPLQWGMLELRKERSRDAARSRRGKENHEFNLLAKMLPLPRAITTQLDKASIIRLTTAYLKIREFCTFGFPEWNGRIISEPSILSKNNHIQSPTKLIAWGSDCKFLKYPTIKHHTTNKNIPAMTTYLSKNSNESIYNFASNNKCIPPSLEPNFGSPNKDMELLMGNNILQSLDGFAFALYNDGRILYVSETVSIYLGLSQVELTGSSIFDYIHLKDQGEFAKMLGIDLKWIYSSNVDTTFTTNASEISTNSTKNDLQLFDLNHYNNQRITNTSSTVQIYPDIAFSETVGTMKCRKNKYNKIICIRMKSTLSKRGNHVKQSGYRVVQLICRFRPKVNQDDLIGMVGIAIAPPPPAIHEIKIENDMFVMRLNLDFSIISCETKIEQFTGLQIGDVRNRTLYSLCHILDLPKLRKHHLDLLKKGQIITDYYRIMAKDAGYIWVQSCATVVSHTSPHASKFINSQTSSNTQLSVGMPHPDNVLDISDNNSKVLLQCTEEEIENFSPRSHTSSGTNSSVHSGMLAPFSYNSSCGSQSNNNNNISNTPQTNINHHHSNLILTDEDSIILINYLICDNKTTSPNVCNTLQKVIATSSDIERPLIPINDQSSQKTLDFYSVTENTHSKYDYEKNVVNMADIAVKRSGIPPQRKKSKLKH